MCGCHWHHRTSTCTYTLYFFLVRHTSDECIYAATVNDEHALLAFTVMKEDIYGEIIYDSFVAEIKPETRVFNLRLENSQFRKLQFIHNEQSPRSRHGRQQQLQSCLLVVSPNAFAAVYTFKLQCIRTGYIVLHEPEKEIFLEDFCWYQWDPTMQWLYCAQFESSSTVVQSSLSGENSLVLHCHSFTAQQKPDLMLTVALPLPYSVQYYQRGETYYTSPLFLTLPVQEINMQMLYLRNGLWCACLQHGTGVEHRKELGEESAEQQDMPEDGKLDYTVFIFNNGHMLHMQVPLPKPVIDPINIHFMVLSGFVVAYVPNLLLHILNVGPGTDPCHHLAFGPNQSPAFPISEDLVHLIGTSESLSPAIPTAIPSQSVSAVIENKTSSHCEVSINTAAFLELFKEATSIEMMEDVLHLTIVGLRHHGMALTMMEHVFQSPMRLGGHRLFSEFLLAFAFANRVFESRWYVSKQLPLTMSPTFCGKVFKNSERVTFAMLRLNPIRKFIVQLLVQSDQRLVHASPDDLLNHEVGDKPFEMLCFIAVTNQTSQPRINVLQEIEAQDKHSLLLSRPLPPVQSHTKSQKQRRHEAAAESTLSRSTILNRITQFTRSGFQRPGNTIQVDSNPGNVLPFLKPDADTEGEEKEIFIGVITKFISSACLQLRSRNIVTTSVRAYCTELERHSHSLLRLMWNSLGFNNDNDPLAHTLYRQPTTQEEILFERLEAYHLGHQEIGFPTPSGFQTLFSSLGFLCLSDTLFLQYLRNGVFVPTRAFIELLLQDLQKAREHLFYEVICYATPQSASWALQQWKHKTVRTLSDHAAVADKKA